MLNLHSDGGARADARSLERAEARGRARGGVPRSLHVAWHVRMMLWPCGPCVAHSTLRVPVKAGTVSHSVPAFTAYRRRPLGAVQAGTPVPALANFCHRRPLSLGSRRLAQNRPVQGQQAFGRWRGRGAAVHGVLTPAVHGRTLEQPFRDADGRCCSYAWLSLVFVCVCVCHACVWIRDGAAPHLDTALCNLCSPTTHWSNVHLFTTHSSACAHS